MADTSLFSRLQRLFSTDVVIRNVGGKNLKVIDTNHIQSSGKYSTNSLVDRFTRLHLYNNKNLFNPNLNYQTLRVQLYTDYEAMDMDGKRSGKWKNEKKNGKRETGKKKQFLYIKPHFLNILSAKNLILSKHFLRFFFCLKCDIIKTKFECKYYEDANFSYNLV